MKARKWGFIDAQGRQVISLKYAEARSFSEGRAAVRSGARWGFIDRNDQLVIPPRFAEVDDFKGGLARVAPTKDGDSGYINPSGALVVPARFESHDTEVDDGVASVQNRQGRSALFDRDGRVIATKQGTLTLLGEGRVGYRDADRGPYGLMDVSGKVIAPPTWDSISRFSESLAAVRTGNRWNFIDRSGQVVFPLAAGEPGAFHEGLAKVASNGRTGYIDRTGRMAIPSKYATGADFSDGLAAVCVETETPPAGPGAQRDLRCGFIDKTGTFVITPRFSQAGAFDGGWASVHDPVFDARVRVNRAGRIVDRSDSSDEPDLQPYGQCQFPPPPPPLPDYRVDVSLTSTPAGASVYLVPLWDWQTHKDGAGLLENKGALETYLVTQGVTPLAIKLKSQAYMGVFDLGGQRKVLQVRVTPTGQRSFTVTF